MEAVFRETKAPINEIRIVLIGKTGSGKSRTGNSILGIMDGKGGFQFGCDANSVTSICSWKSVERLGRKIDIVDTPGVFDTTRANFDVQNEIKRCIMMTTPGPHAIILCVKMGRFTLEDTEALQHFQKYFGEELLNYGIIVFTQVDKYEKDLKDKQITLSNLEFINNLPMVLQSFLTKCGDRYLFFNNRCKSADQDRQVQALIDITDDMVRRNQGKCYTHEMYEKVERLLNEELKKEPDVSRDEMKNSETFWSKVQELLERVIIVLLKILTE